MNEPHPAGLQEMLMNDSHTLWSELQEGLHQLSLSGRCGVSNIIQPIIRCSFERSHHGRSHIFNYLEKHPKLTPTQYIFHVADNYEKLHDYVTRVRRGDPKLWNVFYEDLFDEALLYLLRKGWWPSSYTNDVARGIIHEATFAIIEEHFPYEGPFDLWAKSIVVNQCRKGARRASMQVAIKQLAYVFSAGMQNETTNDPHEILEGIESDLCGRLKQALSCLCAEDKQLIDYHYYQKFSLNDTAEMMGCSCHSVYSRHARVKERLRSIILDDA